MQKGKSINTKHLDGFCYLGYATRKTDSSDVMVILLAKDDISALRIYTESVARHLDKVQAKIEPKLSAGGDIKPFLEMFTPSHLAEFEEYGSVTCC